MTGLGSLTTGLWRIAVGALAAGAAALLLAPGVLATPESDAADAISRAWDAAGGDGSPVGGRSGDVYQVGEGFGQDFTSGKIFFTPTTGARLIYGAILDKYQDLGGPADSDLGFPTIDEVVGLVGPDSRVSTFSASDKPAIFWTPATGAWVVRGAINAAWDKLGGSAGTLGVPIADETYDGDLVAQKFTGGEVSWNRATKAFTTTPPELAANLAGLEVPDDAAAAIDLAWRAAGGLSGPLGARQGGLQKIGDTGAAQDFAGGKVYYSPQTGAHAVTGAILSKYDSLGGPDSDLGWPIATEADGGAPNSRVEAFSAADKPVIFWTPDNGGVVVRGAINAAWAKLGGATGKLGVPIGDQSVDGDSVTQKFSGGEISWNKTTGDFSTKPGDLASALSGLEIPGGGAPGVGPAPTGTGHSGFTWHWWWLLVIIPVLLLLGVLAMGVLWLQRRRSAGGLDEEFGADAEAESAGRRWSAGEPSPGVVDPAEAQLHGSRSAEFSWSSVGAAAGGDSGDSGDSDDVDTTPTRIPTEAELAEFTASGQSPAEEFADAADDDESPSGRHARANLEDAESVWTLGIDEFAWSRRRHSAVGDSDADLAEEVVVAEFVEPDDDSGEPTAEEPVVDVVVEAVEVDDLTTPDEPDVQPAAAEPADEARPAIHLPLADPYEPPEGYLIKANTHSGLYYTPDNELYDHTVPEVWFASEELARANGFVKAE